MSTANVPDLASPLKNVVLQGTGHKPSTNGNECKQQVYPTAGGMQQRCRTGG